MILSTSMKYITIPHVYFPALQEKYFRFVQDSLTKLLRVMVPDHLIQVYRNENNSYKQHIPHIRLYFLSIHIRCNIYMHYINKRKRNTHLDAE